MQEPKVSVIISNYQGRKYLRRCLTCLTNQTYKNYEIIFVDAGSSDGSLEFVRNHFPQIKTLKCGRIGIGESVNKGIEMSSGELLIFDFNTDEYAFPDWIENIVKHLEKFHFKIIAGGVRIIDGTGRIDEAGVKLNWFGKVKKIGHNKNLQNFQFQKKPVDFVGCPSFHRNLLERIGSLDETYFLYAEDLDFCYRAKLAGIETYCVPDAKTFHEIRGTTGSNVKNLEYFLRRSAIRFQIIYFPLFRMYLGLFYLCFFLPVTSFAASFPIFKRRRIYREKFIGRMKAVLWNIKILKNTLKKRNLTKKRWKKSQMKLIQKNFESN